MGVCGAKCMYFRSFTCFTMKLDTHNCIDVSDVFFCVAHKLYSENQNLLEVSDFLPAPRDTNIALKNRFLLNS